MTEIADWEIAGARARAAVPRDTVPVPVALRALTWIGVLLLVAAFGTIIAAVLVAPHEGESAAHAAARLEIVVVAGIVTAAVGLVALLLRLAVGAVVVAVAPVAPDAPVVDTVAGPHGG